MRTSLVALVAILAGCASTDTRPARVVDYRPLTPANVFSEPPGYAGRQAPPVQDPTLDPDLPAAPAPAIAPAPTEVPNRVASFDYPAPPAPAAPWCMAKREPNIPVSQERLPKPSVYVVPPPSRDPFWTKPSKMVEAAVASHIPPAQHQEVAWAWDG